MRYTRNKLLKLRSGQMVWRVLFLVNRNNAIEGSVRPARAIGKRVKFNAFGVSTIHMVLKWESPCTWLSSRYPFLGDMEGDGAFSSERAAKRYVQEVLDGLHPEVERAVREGQKLSLLFPDEYADSTYEYKDCGATQYEDEYYHEGDVGP